MLLWLVPFGFVAGFTFNAITGLDTFAWTGRLGNQMHRRPTRGRSGAMGAFFIGGGVGALLSALGMPCLTEIA
jgi:hypothetical protein